MHAVRIERFGAPNTLQLRELPDPIPSESEVVVEIHAAAVNPIDIAIAAGKIPETRVPRTPGRDYAGVVVQGPQECIGREVWGTSGDFGLTRDGTHAQRVTVPATSIRPKPKNLSMMEAATIGVSFSIAWLALVHRATVQPGETVLIVGASGAVGGQRPKLHIGKAPKSSARIGLSRGILSSTIRSIPRSGSCPKRCLPRQMAKEPTWRSMPWVAQCSSPHSAR